MTTRKTRITSRRKVIACPKCGEGMSVAVNIKNSKTGKQEAWAVITSRGKIIVRSIRDTKSESERFLGYLGNEPGYYCDKIEMRVTK